METHGVEPKSDDRAQRVEELENKIKELSKELRELRKDELPIQADYKFSSSDGDVSLLDLFQNKQDLIVIHNMGKSCPYCTSYADGINGILHHLEDRSAVVLISQDPVAEQKAFAESRGWKFRMISSARHGETFNTDMGFYKPQDGVWPGVSTYHRDGRKITRVSSAVFEPGDEFCVLFPLVFMLQDGVNGWYPKFDYPSPDHGDAESD